MAETSIDLPKIVNHAGETVSFSECTKAPVLAYYFSAHWCPPCRKFTPVLSELYNKWNAEQKQIEIVFLSLDHKEDEYKEYYAQHPWLAAPFEHESIKPLSTKFELEGIPFLAIVSKDGKQLLSGNGYEDVLLKKEKAIDEWKKLY